MMHERDLEKFWNSLSEDERASIRATGIDWENPRTSVQQKIAAIKVAAERINSSIKASDERRKSDEDWHRQSELKHSLMDQFLGGMSSAMRDQSQRMTSAYIQVETERTRAMIGIEAEKMKMMDSLAREMLGPILSKLLQPPSPSPSAEQTQKQLPQPKQEAPSNPIQISVPTYGNCVVGGERLPSAVLTYQKQDGCFYQKCMIAYHAHTRNILPFQIFSNDKLEQAGCPLSTSRNISRRTPGLKVLLRKETCQLADGEERAI
jgi:hypothetical protein